MTLQEQIEKLDVEENKLLHERRALEESWQGEARRIIAANVEGLDPAKLTSLKVASPSYYVSIDAEKDKRVLQLRFGEFCYLTVGEDRTKDFDISTTGYFTHDINEIPKLEEASEMFSLAMKTLKKCRDGDLVSVILLSYKEMVSGEEYQSIKKQITDLNAAIYKAKQARSEEIHLQDAQSLASKRVVGTILRGYSRSSNLILGLVTQVTSTKVRISSFSFYDCYDVEGKLAKTAEEVGPKYIKEIHDNAIANKFGVFVKNKDLSSYEIFKPTK